HGVVRTASHAGMQRNPANVAAHDFNNQNTVVGFRRGVQPVNGVGGNGDGGIKTEGVVGSVDVIVNGLGTPMTGTPLSASHFAPLSVPSPPMAMSASTPASSRLDLMVSNPALNLSGCKRPVPKIVPPRNRMRSMVASSYRSRRRSSISPTQPSS